MDPSSDGKEDILVMTHFFTKWTVAIVTPDQSAASVLRALIRNWRVHYGVPLRPHSDQGRSFEAEVVRQLCDHYGEKGGYFIINDSNGQILRKCGNELRKYYQQPPEVYEPEPAVTCEAPPNTEHQPPKGGILDRVRGLVLPTPLVPLVPPSSPSSVESTSKTALRRSNRARRPPNIIDLSTHC
ncbi:Pol polyprotein [Elysia marginata]|uniref:Pol polyprotein n=1 Tax=Elysia marginata TaxID=1093978 RepID=A0AAV4G2C1_9GAST|nr:Pol polyprotein [Elysia marginata]